MEKSLAQRQLDALDGSIKKWQDIVDGVGVDNGRKNCPCCREFFLDSDGGDNCINCPIRDFAKAPYCRNTPYEQWVDYHVNESEEDWAAVYDDHSAELAKNELEFLIMVRDKFIKQHPELGLSEEVTAKWDKIVSETIGD